MANELNPEKKTMAVSMLAEGNSIRSIERMTGIHRDTIMRLGGDVEVFDLTDHPKAKRAYAWSHIDGKDDQDERFVAVLEIPPVKSAETAVRVQIVKDAKQRKK